LLLLRHRRPGDQHRTSQRPAVAASRTRSPRMAATWPAPRDSATISRTSALVGGRRRVSIADVAHHAVSSMRSMKLDGKSSFSFSITHASVTALISMYDFLQDREFGFRSGWLSVYHQRSRKRRQTFGRSRKGELYEKVLRRCCRRYRWQTPLRRREDELCKKVPGRLTRSGRFGQSGTPTNG
jgi:hypothetical protein